MVGRAVMGRAVGVSRDGMRRGGACRGGVRCRESLPKQPFLPGKGRDSKPHRPGIST